MKAWMTAMAPPNAFQSTLGAHMIHSGIRVISASMMPPAKMLPKSRRARVTGLISSSSRLSGNITGNGSKKCLK